ncbi:hypothetical protein PIB30_054384 [Stylosanthes scabra]|uniref:Uncharacterized protein n=1 Tax=Stylosanthes scabra TaxID=79078 RepID=A0ABU6TL38_9FABA|nr:hypothetical protein [Stylosanthes scabra]
MLLLDGMGQTVNPSNSWTTQPAFRTHRPKQAIMRPHFGPTPAPIGPAQLASAPIAPAPAQPAQRPFHPNRVSLETFVAASIGIASRFYKFIATPGFKPPTKN